MANYYEILSRALRRGDAADERWRREVYGRTRQMLLQQLRARPSQVSINDGRRQLAALDAAIETIESEFQQTSASGGVPKEGYRQARRARLATEPADKAGGGIAAWISARPIYSVVLAVAVAVAIAGAYALLDRAVARKIRLVRRRPRTKRRRARRYSAGGAGAEGSVTTRRRACARRRRRLERCRGVVRVSAAAGLLPHDPPGRDHHHRQAAALPLPHSTEIRRVALRDRCRQPMHRSRRAAAHFQQGRVAGVAAYAGTGRPQARSGRGHARRSRQSARCAPYRRSKTEIQSTAPTPRRRSAIPRCLVASAWSTTTSSICISACRSADAWS